MRRLTKQDWETINEALALLEASLDDELLRRPGESEEQAEARLNDTRATVQERM
jgi:hypothetical protein